jgi:low temperature requirement protein LtrA
MPCRSTSDGYAQGVIEAEATDSGKRVSWVELYFDLIFVFAISQAARDIAERPTWSGLTIAFGVFLTLWWTWIGFVVLYNRNVEDRPSRRLFVLAGTLPCAVAAVQLQNAPEGDLTGFTLSLAAARVILAVAYPVCAPGSAAARRASVGYGLSTVLFVAAPTVAPQAGRRPA